MTPDALRGLARRKEAAADSLLVDADRLRVQASIMDRCLDPLIPMSQRVWVGPAASDFEDKVQSLSAMLMDQARRVRDVARELDREAQTNIREAAELRARAAAAEVAELGATAAVGGIG